MANIYVRSTDGNDADDGSTWALAKATLAGALVIATASDIIWVSQDHAESAAGAKTLTFPTTPGLRILCGNDSAEPPTALATTASITTTGNNAITIPSGFAYVYGVIFNSGTGNSAASDLLIAGAALAKGMVFESCQFNNLSTSASADPKIGAPASANNDDDLLTFINSSFSFGSTGQTIFAQYGRLIFQGITLTGASAPSTLFTLLANVGTDMTIEGSDLSGLAFTNMFDVTAAGTIKVTLRNTKLPASITVVTGTNPGPGGPLVRMHNCDSADTNYRFAEHSFEGSIVNETTIVRTGGASDGTTPIAWKMVSSAGTLFWHPLQSPEIVRWNEAVGSPLTVTVEFVHDSVTNAQDDEIWLEVEYLGTSGTPLGIRASDRMTNILSTPADQADSSEAWTTTGLANPNTRKLSVSITPQEKGFIHARVMVANPSTTYYIDPLMTVA